MTPKILIRAAAVSLAVLFLGHTAGAMLFPESRGAAEDALFAAMALFRFPIMGFERSHLDFYMGEGWYLSLALAVVVALLWQLSNLAATQPRLVRSLLLPLIAFCVGSTVLCTLFFFAAPLATSVIATLALIPAWLRLRSA